MRLVTQRSFEKGIFHELILESYLCDLTQRYFLLLLLATETLKNVNDITMKLFIQASNIFLLYTEHKNMSKSKGKTTSSSEYKGLKQSVLDIC